MFNTRWMFLVLAMFCFLSIMELTASENITVNNFSSIEKKINALGKKYGVKNVIVAYDVDCTLVTQADNFASDIWLNWQLDLLANNPNSPFLINKDFEKILTDQRIIQLYTKVYPTEENIPEIIKKLQTDGFVTIALTARGPENRNSTELQLKKCGFNFNDGSLSYGFPGTYLPYDVNDPKRSGLTAEEINNFNLKAPKYVSFANGIMMVAGQNKGIMLKTLLQKTGKEFKTVVLVDDGKKNTDNMYNVYKASDIDVNCFRYSYDDALKKQFDLSNKNNVIKQWREYKTTIDTVFGK